MYDPTLDIIDALRSKDNADKEAADAEAEDAADAAAAAAAAAAADGDGDDDDAADGPAEEAAPTTTDAAVAPPPAVNPDAPPPPPMPKGILAEEDAWEAKMFSRRIVELILSEHTGTNGKGRQKGVGGGERLICHDL